MLSVLKRVSGFAVWTAVMVVAVIGAEVVLAVSWGSGDTAFVPPLWAVELATFFVGLTVWVLGFFVFLIAASLGRYVVRMATRAIQHLPWLRNFGGAGGART